MGYEEIDGRCESSVLKSSIRETGVARAASWIFNQREGRRASDVQEIGRKQSESMLREQLSDGGFVVNVDGGGFVVDVEKRRWPGVSGVAEARPLRQFKN